MKEKLTALVYDGGDQVHFAQALSASFHQVLYFCDWLVGHPHQKDTLVGDMPGLKRVNWFWKHIDQADVIIFLDCGQGDEIAWLRKKGYRVWGCGLSDNLELDRVGFRNVLKTFNLAHVPDEIVTGIPALEKYLKDPKHDNTWIKVSFFRGDSESHHHVNWFLSQPWFHDLEHNLGPGAESFAFLCQKSVPGVEPGYDGYSVDGQFPELGMWGWEYKNRGYVQKVQRVIDMPAAVRTFEDLGPILGTLGMRGNFHTEQRVSEDGEVYITDPTTRLGTPPGEIMGLLIENWADIIYRGAAGELVEPKVIAPYGAQVVFYGDWAKTHHVSFQVPKELVPFFRFRRAYRDEKGVYWHIPDGGLKEVGSAIGFGDSPEEAIDAAIAIAEEVKAYDIEYAPDVKDKLLKLIQEGEDAGISFGGERRDELVA